MDKQNRIDSTVDDPVDEDSVQNTVTLNAASMASAKTSNHDMPVITLVGDEDRAIRVEVDRDGCAMLKQIAAIVETCLDTGAHTTGVPLRGRMAQYPADLPGRLVQARRNVDLSISQAAKRAGINPSTVSRFESGGKRPLLTRLGQMAAVYRMGLDELLAQDDQPPEAGRSTSPSARSTRHQATPAQQPQRRHSLACADGQSTIRRTVTSPAVPPGGPSSCRPTEREDILAGIQELSPDAAVGLAVLARLPRDNDTGTMVVTDALMAAMLHRGTHTPRAVTTELCLRGLLETTSVPGRYQAVVRDMSRLDQLLDVDPRAIDAALQRATVHTTIVHHVAALYNDGHSLSSCAAACGRHESAVQRLLEINGVPLRPGHGPRRTSPSPRDRLLRAPSVTRLLLAMLDRRTPITLGDVVAAGHSTTAATGMLTRLSNRGFLSVTRSADVSHYVLTDSGVALAKEAERLVPLREPQNLFHMRQRGMSPAEVGRQVGFSRQTVSLRIKAYEASLLESGSAGDHGG